MNEEELQQLALVLEAKLQHDRQAGSGHPVKVILGTSGTEPGLTVKGFIGIYDEDIDLIISFGKENGLNGMYIQSIPRDLLIEVYVK